MARWTVQFGEDVIVVERNPNGTLVIDLPARRPIVADVVVDRAKIEDFRLKLGAALVKEESPSDD